MLHYACFIYKVKQTKTPTYLFDMLISTENCHQHNTRPKLFIPSIKKNAGKKMFNFFAPQFWNTIPNNIKNIPSFFVFKKLMIEHISTLTE